VKKSFVCIVCTGLPHPSQGASAVVYHHYIVAIRAAGYDVGALCLTQSGATQAVLDLTTYYGNLDISVAMCSAQTFYLGRFGSYRLVSDAVSRARIAAARFKPDKIVCFDLLAAWIGSEVFPGLPRVVWLGDLHFQTNWYHALYALREEYCSADTVINVLRALLYGFGWRRVYRAVLKGDANIIVCNKSSEAVLAKLGVRAGYAPYPWPLPAHRDRPRESNAVIPTFLFFGNLQGLGSRSALHFLTEKLYPLLVRQFAVDKFKIQICGRGSLYPWAKAAIELRSEFEFLGFVEDLEGLLKRCDAMLVPIELPIGNRTRIVTAMAQRTLVIAHKNAALGNPDLIDGETCLLAGNEREFAEKMAWIVAQRSQAAQIVERAFDRYKRTFLPEAATVTLLNML
jgi:glycosyltransferase involved in cell wall biosynthesis